MLINLKPGHDAQQRVMDRLRGRAQQVPGVTLYLQPTQDLTIDAEGGPTQYRVSLEGADTAVVTQWAARLAAQLHASPRLRHVQTDAQAAGASVSVEIDRDTAARLGSRGPHSRTGSARRRRGWASPPPRSTRRCTARSASASCPPSSPRPTSTG